MPPSTTSSAPVTWRASSDARNRMQLATSTAWAAVEHLHQVNGCRALFATHYHELTALAG